MTVIIDGRPVTEGGGGSSAAKASGRAVASDGATQIGTTWQAIPGCEVTLPSSGTYSVAYFARSEILVSGDGFVCFRLFNVTEGVGLEDTESFPSFNLTGQAACSMEMFITVDAETVIRLDGRASRATNCRVSSDFNGRTVISFNGI